MNISDELMKYQLVVKPEFWSEVLTQGTLLGDNCRVFYKKHRTSLGLRELAEIGMCKKNGECWFQNGLTRSKFDEWPWFRTHHHNCGVRADGDATKEGSEQPGSQSSPLTSSHALHCQVPRGWRRERQPWETGNSWRTDGEGILMRGALENTKALRLKGSFSLSHSELEGLFSPWPKCMGMSESQHPSGLDSYLILPV